ncbi:MAG: GNAT family N-acetyltransferase [Myxococcales bacterium]|nr:GNAT family N-acetyltransferase [Myxococcales bacterium]
MEIRTLEKSERDRVLGLLDQWELQDGWRGRNYFRRHMDYDPGYRDQNIWVAAEGEELLACVQIYPRRVRVLGHGIPTGGLGTLFTAPEHRGKRLASMLIEAAVNAMIEQGMEISLLHAQNQDIFLARGWHSWTSDRSILRRTGSGSVASDPKSTDSIPPSREVKFAPFDHARDLAAVKVIHSAYSASRSGTVVRDDEQWDASLCLAGNPMEEFLVARQNGAVVAYARCTLLGGVLTLTELGRLEDASVALALLVSSILEEREQDDLAPRGVSSRELRNAAMLPAFDDLPLTVALEHRGLSSHPVADPSSMLRCLNMNALAERLDIALFPDERPERFLERILPRDALVFWPADRF